MEPIRLWGCADDPYFVRSEPSPYGEGYHEYAALPRADFDALAAEAADARTLRAERDSLVKERDEAVADNIRLDQALRHAVASGKPDAVPSWQYELMRESNRRHRELRDAATARAEKAEALLREARAGGWFTDDPSMQAVGEANILARIDAHLGEAPGPDDRKGVDGEAIEAQGGG